MPTNFFAVPDNINMTRDANNFAIEVFDHETDEIEFPMQFFRDERMAGCIHDHFADRQPAVTSAWGD